MQCMIRLKHALSHADLHAVLQDTGFLKAIIALLKAEGMEQVGLLMAVLVDSRCMQGMSPAPGCMLVDTYTVRQQLYT